MIIFVGIAEEGIDSLLPNVPSESPVSASPVKDQKKTTKPVPKQRVQLAM